MLESHGNGKSEFSSLPQTLQYPALFLNQTKMVTNRVAICLRLHTVTILVTVHCLQSLLRIGMKHSKGHIFITCYDLI